MKKKKGGIHIKEENRGKYTEKKGGKITQAKIDKDKKSSNLTLKREAVFADNARHHFKKQKKS